MLQAGFARLRAATPPVEVVTAVVKAVHGSLDALEMRPFETVPQRMGRPVPYGEALRRADMLQ